MATLNNSPVSQVVVIIPYDPGAGKFLFVKRAKEGLDHPNSWSFPSGNLNPHERRDPAGILECANRELKAETGITAKEFKVLGSVNEKNQQVNYILAICDQAKLDSTAHEAWEVQNYQWSRQPPPEARHPGLTKALELAPQLDKIPLPEKISGYTGSPNWFDKPNSGIFLNIDSSQYAATFNKHGLTGSNYIYNFSANTQLDHNNTIQDSPLTANQRERLISVLSEDQTKNEKIIQRILTNPNLRGGELAWNSSETKIDHKDLTKAGIYAYVYELRNGQERALIVFNPDILKLESVVIDRPPRNPGEALREHQIYLTQALDGNLDLKRLSRIIEVSPEHAGCLKSKEKLDAFKVDLLTRISDIQNLSAEHQNFRVFLTKSHILQGDFHAQRLLKIEDPIKLAEEIFGVSFKDHLKTLVARGNLTAQQLRSLKAEFFNNAADLFKIPLHRERTHILATAKEDRRHIGRLKKLTGSFLEQKISNKYLKENYKKLLHGVPGIDSPKKEKPIITYDQDPKLIILNQIVKDFEGSTKTWKLTPEFIKGIKFKIYAKKIINQPEELAKVKQKVEANLKTHIKNQTLRLKIKLADLNIYRSPELESQPQTPIPDAIVKILSLSHEKAALIQDNAKKLVDFLEMNEAERLHSIKRSCGIDPNSRTLPPEWEEFQATAKTARNVIPIEFNYLKKLAA